MGVCILYSIIFFYFRFLVRVSYYEIYNEDIRDLLSKNVNKKLDVKERPDIGVYINDLSTYIVNNADDMDRIMTLGNKNSKDMIHFEINLNQDSLLMFYNIIYTYFHRDCRSYCNECREFKISCHFLYHRGN